MKVIILGLVVFLILGCRNESNITQEVVVENNLSSKDSLKLVIKNLKKYDPNITNSDFDLNLNKPSEGFLNKEDFEWFYQELKDSSKFEYFGELKPLGKFFENNHILSVAFTDVHDYWSGIYVINYNKSELIPISSFVLYRIGGDGEDFFITKIESDFKDYKFKIRNEDGYFNDVETQDTTFINKKEIFEVSIDTLNGNINRKILSKKSNYYELKNK